MSGSVRGMPSNGHPYRDPMLGFKTLRCARILLAGIEVMHMIRNGQLGAINDPASSAANPFYSPAF